MAYEALSAGTRDPAFRVVAETAHPYAAFLVARYEEALRASDEVLRLTEQDPTLGRGFVLQNPRAFAAAFRALPLMGLGRFAEALPTALEGIELAQRFEDRESLAWSHTFAACVYCWGGRAELEKGLAHATSAIEIGLEMGHIQSQIIGRIFLGDLIARTGETEAGIGVMEETYEGMLSRMVCVEFEPFLLASLSRAALETGNAEKAVELAARAHQIVSNRGAASYAGLTDARLAEALATRAAVEDLARADALLAEAEHRIETPGGFDGPWLLRARAALCEARGDEPGRWQALGAALEMARGMAILGLVADLEAELSAA
jgi:tetratricopeptide (TPR) repeat protein